MKRIARKKINKKTGMYVCFRERISNRARGHITLDFLTVREAWNVLSKADKQKKADVLRKQNMGAQ